MSKGNGKVKEEIEEEVPAVENEVIEAQSEKPDLTNVEHVRALLAHATQRRDNARDAYTSAKTEVEIYTYMIECLEGKRIDSSNN